MLPINIPIHLPAKQVLESEHIFVMDESRAFHQDIRPQRIVILNLMPKNPNRNPASETAWQFAFTSALYFFDTQHTYTKNTARQHLDEFYTTFSSIRDKKFDGMIVTGAPIEHLAFEDVSYWEELKEILEWSKSNVTSTLHICWGAQAGLYYHYGIEKVNLPKKPLASLNTPCSKKREIGKRF